MNNREMQEQKTLFDWAKLNEAAHPELKMMFHVPNEGKRSVVGGAELKRAGLKSGVPDVILPVARSGYNGLAIEMKVDHNRPTEKQKEWLRGFSREGWKVYVCWGWDIAAHVISEYMGFKSQIIGKMKKMEEWSDDI